MTAQGTSTNPTNIMEQTPWPGNHEYKPWPGYTQARLLWIHQNHHLQWQFTSGQQSWTSKNYAKGYQDKHTGHHSPWQNPITSGINIQMKNCDKSQQHKRRPKPTTSITTHIAKMPKHATIKTNTYPEDHTQERSIRRCETRKKKS